MRNLICLGVGFLGIAAAGLGCSDDENGSGGSAGGETTTTTTTTSAGPSTTSSGSSTSATSSAMSSSSTGTPGCENIGVLFQTALGDTSWSADLTPPIGGADPDFLVMYIPEGTSGAVQLDPVMNLLACGDTTSCVLVFEDFVDPNPPAHVYAAVSGDIQIDSIVSSGAVDGTLTDVDFVEVTIDNNEVTEVRNGGCLVLDGASFNFDGK